MLPVKNHKIIIVGASLVGLTYALFLKSAGIAVEIYEKRPESDIEKLQSMLYLKKNTLLRLSPYIDQHIFNAAIPKAFKSPANKKVHMYTAHANVRINDLLNALLIEAKKCNIPIHRGWTLIYFNKEGTQKIADFIHDNKTQISISYDQLLLACGNKDSRTILGNASFPSPIQLHHTNTLVGKIRDDFSHFDAKIKSLSGAYPDIKNHYTYFWHAIKKRFNVVNTSCGNLGLYFVTPCELNFLLTYPPELAPTMKANKAFRIKYLTDAFQRMAARIDRKDGNHDYSWLKQLNAFDEETIHSVSAFASVLPTNLNLLKRGVIPIGDALVSTPFIWGSEYNEHVVRFFPVLLNTLTKLVTGHLDEDTILNEFIENTWECLLDKHHIAKYLNCVDPMGNTVLPDGTRINPNAGYLFSRNTLENPHHSEWIDIPHFQQGGLVTYA